MKYFKTFENHGYDMDGMASSDLTGQLPYNLHNKGDENVKEDKKWILRDALKDGNIEEATKIVKEIGANYEMGLPIRFAIKFGNLEFVKEFEKLGASFNRMSICHAAEMNKKDIVKYVFDRGHKDTERAIKWLKHSRHLNPDQKLEMTEFLNSL